MSDPAEEAALARVPDLPQWVDTRGMLLTRRAIVTFPSSARLDRDGFVVELASRALLSAIDNPPIGLIAERALSMRGDVNVLCTTDTADVVARALPSWMPRGVSLHALPGVAAWESDANEGDVSIFTLANAPSLEHVEASLKHEIVEAMEGHPSARFVPGVLPERTAADVSTTAVPIAAAWVEGQPVAFCYPVLRTETLWDDSVETLAVFRGRGLAGRAARVMVRHMRKLGKAPVWGALDSNESSLRVARKLGFAEAGRLTVFAPR
jgi:hypothetical protein